MIWWFIIAISESVRLTSIREPSPVWRRFSSAAWTAITAYSPVLRSVIEAATRTGGPSNSPVMFIRPVKAWISGS